MNTFSLVRAWTLSLAAAATLTSCAFGTRHVTLQYPAPSAQPAGLVGEAQAATEPAVSGPAMILVRFTDDRPDRAVVGEVRNGLGMRTASVVADNDVAAWVTEAVAYELRKAGYRVTRADAADPTAIEPVVTGRLTHCLAIALLSYEGTVDLSVQVRRGSETLLDRSYEGKKSAGLSMTASGGGYGNALAGGLAAALEKFVADLKGVVPPN